MMSNEPSPWKLRMVTQGKGRGQTVTVWLNDEEVVWVQGSGDPVLKLEGNGIVNNVELLRTPPRRWFRRISRWRSAPSLDEKELPG